MTEKCPGSGSWFGVLLWHRFSLWPSASLLPRLCFSVSMCPALSEERLLPTLVPCTTMCWSFHTEPSEVSSSVHAVPDASESSQLQLLGCVSTVVPTGAFLWAATPFSCREMEHSYLICPRVRGKGFYSSPLPEVRWTLATSNKPAFANGFGSKSYSQTQSLNSLYTLTYFIRIRRPSKMMWP